MKWKRLTAKNFLSFEELSLDLDNRGIILVEGNNLTSSKFKSNGSGKCVRGNQRIYDMDNQRYIPIKDFVKDKVSTTLGVVNYKTDIVKVTDWHKLGKKKIYKVTTDTGSCIEVAETHPILTEVGCKPVKDIAVGDWVAEVRELKQGGRPEIAYSDVLWTKVKSIEYLGEDDCYDITVDTPDHLYVCENFVVHNSSLLEPLVYALYDTTSKGIKADDVVNNKVGKNTEVILEGVKGGDTYRIERYRKHSKNKNKVKLFINGKEVTEKSAAETNKTIQRIIGIDYNTFINSIMFSQGNGAGRFAIATDKEKKEILENLVHLDIYAKAQAVAKERLKKKEEEIALKEQEKTRLDWEFERIESLEKQDRENYENTKQMILQEHQNIRTLVDTLDKFTSTNFPAVEEIKGQLEELNKQRESAAGFDVSAHILEAVNTVKQQLAEKQAQYQQQDYQKNQLVEQYKKLHSNTHCPVCGNELDTAHRHAEMENIKQKLAVILTTIKQLQQEMEPLNQQVQEATAKYQEARAKQDEANQNYQSIVQAISRGEQQIRQYEDTIQQYRNKIDAAQNTVNKLSEIPEPKPRDKEREEVDKKIKVFREELLKLQEERLQLEDVVKVFSNSGVKSHVLDLITPFLNERANHHLATLSGPDMEVKFSTQTRNKDGSMSDKFDIELINHVGGGSYKSNSEGEKKRADLAISLAIQDLVMGRGEPPTNFIVYDEVFDALDSVGSENVVTLLRQRVHTVGTIFVITHSEHLKPLFDKVITVTKNKSGVSTVDGGVETS